MGPATYTTGTDPAPFVTVIDTTASPPTKFRTESEKGYVCCGRSIVELKVSVAEATGAWPSSAAMSCSGFGVEWSRGFAPIAISCASHTETLIFYKSC